MVAPVGVNLLQEVSRDPILVRTTTNSPPRPWSSVRKVSSHLLEPQHTGSSRHRKPATCSEWPNLVSQIRLQQEVRSSGLVQRQKPVCWFGHPELGMKHNLFQRKRLECLKHRFCKLAELFLASLLGR